MSTTECPYCDYDSLSSHYHCGNCGEETGMFGHYGKKNDEWEFSCTRNDEWIERLEEEDEGWG